MSNIHFELKEKCAPVSIRQTDPELPTLLSHHYLMGTLTVLQCLLLSTLATLFHNFVTLHMWRLFLLFELPFLLHFLFWKDCFYPLRHHSMHLFLKSGHGPQSPGLPMLPFPSPSALLTPAYTLHFLTSHTVSNSA